MSAISAMLVDDNPTFLRVAAQFLATHDDIDVIGTANNGPEALEKLKELQPQVILVDLAMPGTPGLEIIAQLRETQPDLNIIALTVMDNYNFRRAAIDAGAHAFVSKATMRSDLLPTIRQLVHSDAKTAAVKSTLSRNGSQGPRRVLVMEDDDYLLRLYSRALKENGYRVHQAATMQKARDLLAQVRFDILLCDIHMGEERGTDLLAEYSDTLFTNGTQVVIISGQAQYRESCEELGADFFLEKPVALGTLVALVDRITARH